MARMQIDSTPPLARAEREFLENVVKTSIEMSGYEKVQLAVDGSIIVITPTGKRFRLVANQLPDVRVRVEDYKP